MADPIVNLRADRHIPVAVPKLDHGEAEAVADCVRRGWISQGPRVAEFEREFAASHGKAHGVACHSGTAALNLALAAAGIAKHERVVCPTLTMVAVPNAIRYVDAIPVFVDSEPWTGNMDPELTLHAIRETRARAVIVPHLYGAPAEAAIAIAGEFKDCSSPILIEDCAEAHYATDANGDPVGTHSRFATFSFYSNKIICCGEGGMAITNSEPAANALRSLRAHAFSPETHFTHTGLAYGDRMTDMQAAVGLVQHRNRGSILRHRDRLAFHYYQNIPDRFLWGRDPCVHSGTNPPKSREVWWVMPIRTKSRDERDELRNLLAQNGIETRTFFVPMHRQVHLKQHAFGQSFPTADRLADEGLYLPLHCMMDLDDVDYICSAIKRSFN